MTTIETITPERARELLRNAGPNYPVNIVELWRMVDDMKAGRWELRPTENIHLQNGRLVSGQRRCLACVLADVPFITRVISDAHP